MTKQAVILIVSSIIFIGAAVGGYLVFYKTRVNNEAKTNKYSPTTTSEEKSTEPQTEQVQSGSQLQVRGTSTDESNDQNSLPTPKNFSVYEKFSKDETASYVDIVKGSGEEAVSGDMVAIVYKGWLTNGELFDQSSENDKGQIEPIVVQLGSGQVIPGWEQTIVGMRKGGKRRLVIPPAAGYGANGQGSIPPNAVLIFDVELAQIQKEDLNPPGVILP